MKTSVAVLTLSLFYLSVAEPVPEDHCKSALRELEAKLQKTEEKLDDLKKEVQGNKTVFVLYYFQVASGSR